MKKYRPIVCHEGHAISAEHRAQSCTGKIRYRHHQDARAEAERLQVSADVGPVAVYRCGYCRGWHVGKAAKLILSRLRVVKAAA